MWFIGYDSIQTRWFISYRSINTKESGDKSHRVIVACEVEVEKDKVYSGNEIEPEPKTVHAGFSQASRYISVLRW